MVSPGDGSASHRQREHRRLSGWTTRARFCQSRVGATPSTSPSHCCCSGLRSSPLPPRYGTRCRLRTARRMARRMATAAPASTTCKPRPRPSCSQPRRTTSGRTWGAAQATVAADRALRKACHGVPPPAPPRPSSSQGTNTHDIAARSDVRAESGHASETAACLAGCCWGLAGRLSVEL